MRIAIITASIGNGHNSVAVSMKKMFQTRYSLKEVEVFDLLDDGKIYNLIKNLYYNVLKTPYIYSKFYNWTQSHNKSTSFISYLDFIFLKSLKDIKKRYKPDLFIFTHPLPSKSYNLSLKIPAWTIITDLSFHPIWHNQNINGYFVANENIKRDLYNMKYNASKIYETGIPVDDNFIQKTKKSENSTGQNKLVLIMGGGLGLGSIKDVFLNVNSLDKTCNGIVLTGKNHILYNEMKNLTAKSKKWIILPFTDSVPYWMKKADFIITKAGGVTLSEALVSCLPTIIYEPIPGHEEENAHIACEEGWAKWAKNPEELIYFTNKIFNSETILKKMKSHARRCSKPFAAMQVAEIIHREYNFALRRSL